MADGFIGVAIDGGGKLVDNSVITVGANTVYRQRLNIADPTNATSITAVKAASTAAAATDPSLVVAISPNSPLPAGNSILGAVLQSGTWTITQGAAAAVASAWTAKITDGTNVGAVKAASTAALAADPAQVVALSPNSPLPAGLATIGVINQGTAASVANSWTAKITDGTRVTAVKAASTAAAAADLAMVVAMSPNSPMPLGTLTKGTQNSTGISTQDLKDSGRVNIMWTADTSVTAAAETLVSLSESRDGAAVTTSTSKTVTSGERLRITSITVSASAGGSAPSSATLVFRLRFNTAGAVNSSSPLQHIIRAPSFASANITTFASVNFPDGIEFLGDGTKQIGVTVSCGTWVSGTNVPTYAISISGFEY